jgi:hypothetical protein
MSLSWTAGKDVVLAKVLRSPGPKEEGRRRCTQGRRGSSSTGSSARGRGTAAEVTLVDRAGNESSKTVGLHPTDGIFSPADGAVVAARRVVPVGKARFLQPAALAREPQLLTTWVKRPKLALPLRWKFRGARRSLVDGNYRLYVRPAFGQRGTPLRKLIGQIGFVVSSVVEAPSTGRSCGRGPSGRMCVNRHRDAANAIWRVPPRASASAEMSMGAVLLAEHEPGSREASGAPSARGRVHGLRSGLDVPRARSRRRVSPRSRDCRRGRPLPRLRG